MNRKRKREEAKIELVASKRHPQRERNSTGQAIASALYQIQQTATALALSKTEQAVQLFQKNYGDMTVENQLIVFKIFENVRKCELFITMTEGELRDAWI